MEIKPEYRDKTIRSFVVRAGRMTKAQRSAFELGWDAYGLRLADGAIDLDAVFGRNNPKVVEIGFGMGDSLLQMAAAEPNTDFIGIEVHPPGVGTLLNRAHVSEIKNLKVYLADANDVIDECLGAASINRLQLYFPDPWHKKKHNKRRIVQAEFAQTIRRILKVGGVFHMATDWEAYSEHMMEVMESAEGFRNVSGENQYAEHPEYRPYTKFEKRGQNLGHGVWDLLFERVS